MTANQGFLEKLEALGKLKTIIDNQLVEKIQDLEDQIEQLKSEKEDLQDQVNQLKSEKVENTAIQLLIVKYKIVFGSQG